MRYLRLWLFPLLLGSLAMQAAGAAHIASDERTAARVQALLDDMHAKLRKQDFEGAFAKYQEVRSVDPTFNDPTPLYCIGEELAPLSADGTGFAKLHPELHALERKLVPLIRAAVDAKEPNYFHTDTLASLLVDIGDVAGARAAIDRYAAKAPADLFMHRLRLWWAPQPGDAEAAVRALQAQIAAAGDDAEKLIFAGEMGYSLLREREHVPLAQRTIIIRESLNAFTRAAALDPKSIEAATYRGLLLRKQAEDEPDPAKRKTLEAKADLFRTHSKALIKAKQQSP